MAPHRVALVLLVSAALALAQATRPNIGRASARFATADFSRARQMIADGMRKDSVPGLAVAVARGDSILWEEGFGWADRETRVPATPNTPFYLASITKTITATAAMILRERGRLDLDRPANDYLGMSRLRSPAWDARGATVRRLATHMSGLTTFDLHCAAEQQQCRAVTSDEIIGPYGVLVWPPGEQFDYSNIGYYVLGEIVGRAAGRDLGTFLRDELFLPLGMTHASLGIDARLAAQTARQYSFLRGRLSGQTIGVSGASSAYASAHDLLRFGAMHAKARRLGTRAVLSDAAIDTMQNATVSTGSSRYGLGWWVDEDRFGYRSVLAQGGTDAASAWLRIIPSERITVVVLANRGVNFTSDVVDAVLSALLPRYSEMWAARRTQAAGAPNPPAAPRSLDSAFVGTWRGIVRDEAGDVPLQISVAESGTVRATIGSPTDERSGRAWVSGPTLRLNIPGDLATRDSASGRRLVFYLRPRDGVLNGATTTRPRAASGLDGQVSYWVELRKSGRL